MRVGFTGTRKGMTAEQRGELQAYLSARRVSAFHHGCCVGADAEAHEIAFTLLGISIVPHPPDDEKALAPSLRGFALAARSPKPYLERDRDIVDETDVLVACPSEASQPKSTRSGTWYTVRYADRTGKPVHIIWPDGTRTSGYDRIIARPYMRRG